MHNAIWKSVFRVYGVGAGAGAGDDTGETLKVGMKVCNGGRLSLGNDGIIGKSSTDGFGKFGWDGFGKSSTDGFAKSGWDGFCKSGWGKSGWDGFGKSGVIGCGCTVVWRRLRASTLMLDIVATKSKDRMKDLEEAIDDNLKNCIERICFGIWWEGNGGLMVLYSVRERLVELSIFNFTKSILWLDLLDNYTRSEYNDFSSSISYYQFYLRL